MVEFQGKNLIIMCCSSCNVKCKHCYIEYKGNFSCDELKKIVLELNDKYNISLNGSELLLNKEYLNILKILKQYRVLTNGIVIHNNLPLLTEMKKSGIKWVCMSYHFALHDSISNINKQIIFDNITELKRYGFNIEIMTTISSINYKDIEDMVKEAILLGVDCIRFTNLFNEGNAIHLDSKLILNDDQINEFFDQFYFCKEKYGNNLTIRRSGTFSRDFRKVNSSYYCPSMELTVALAPNYKIYPCPFLIKEGYEIGKYENGKIYLENIYENDSSQCMLHCTLNRGKEYAKHKC